MNGSVSARSDVHPLTDAAVPTPDGAAATEPLIRAETAPFTPNGGYTGQGTQGRSLGLVLALGVHAVLLAILLLNWGIRSVSREAPSLAVFDVAPAPPDPAPQPDPEPAPEPTPQPERPTPPVHEQAPSPIEIAPLRSMPALPPVKMVEMPVPPHPVPPRTAAETPPRPATQAPSDAKPTWEGKVLAALNAMRRYPREAAFRRQQGVPWIRFVMDRQGKVLAVSLEQSSGIAALDKEALQLPRRAAPLPAPPDDVTGTTIELVVPVEFFLS